MNKDREYQVVNLFLLMEEHSQLREFFHKEQLFQEINPHREVVFPKQDHVYEVIFDYVLVFLQVELFVEEYPNIDSIDVVHRTRISMSHCAIEDLNR